MVLPWEYGEQDANHEPLLRYDHRLADPKEHPEAMRAAAQLVKEATARNLKLNVVTRRLKPEPSWCEQVTATITVGNDTDAGRILGYQISRKDLRRNSKPFHYYLDIPSEGACNVANAVFDRLGRLKKHLYGNFNAETDQGDLLYVRDIKIKPHLQKKGLACFALKLLLQQLSHRRSIGAVNEEVWAGRWWFAVMHREECEYSWRPAGFRVLDRTRFLACCAMKGHKSWDDTQPDPPPLDDDVLLPKRALDKALMHLVQCNANSNSGPTKQSLHELYVKAERLLAAGADIKTSMAVQVATISNQRPFLGWLLSHGADINQQDTAGNTALHFAAHSGQAQFLEELLEMKASPLLKTTAGFTPLDVCILEMQFQREYQDACLDGFKGHDAKYIAVIRRLQNTGIKMERLTCLPVPKNKWGCTCGGCLNGYLSPRMHFRLKTLARTLHADGLMDLGDVDYPADLIQHPELVDPDLWLYQYLPVSLCRQVSRKFAVGWFRLFGIIHISLNSDTVPTASQVLRGIAESATDVRSCIKFYLDQGGKVEYALDALLGQSRRENEITGDVTGAYDMGQLGKLIKCENDDDYTFLLRLLCHNEFTPSGPYFDDHDVRSKIAHEMSHMPRPLYSIPPDDGEYD